MSDKKAPKTDEKAPETAAVAATIAPATDEKAPETAEKAPERAPKAKGVKVKFLRTHPAFAVSTGEETEISQDDFDKYIQDGPFFERIHTR